MSDDLTIPRTSFPPDGVTVTLPEGKVLTRVHLDLGKEGITLSHVGAASAASVSHKRQQVVLKAGSDGISLALVGAASTAK